MKTLVLCVDRDNDIGVKTGIEGPVIGKEANVRAANRLGMADPEDTDLNTLFMAVRMYDDLVRAGVPVEIATVCGDERVGPRSDTVVAAQLDQVLEEVRPDHAYLVSDGADDEYVYPLITSRIKVNHVKRVYVRQSPSIESTYYMFVKTLKDERFRGKLATPVALVLILYGALSLLAFAFRVSTEGLIVLMDVPASFISSVILVMGLYMFLKTHPMDLSPRRFVRGFKDSYRNLKERVVTRDVSPVFDGMAAIFLLLGIFLGWDAAMRAEPLDPAKYVGFFLGGFTIPLILAISLHEVGNIVTAYFQKGRLPASFWAVMIFLLVISTFIGVTFESVRIFLGIQDRAYINYIVFILGMVLVVTVAGFLVYRATGAEIEPDDAWRH
jgi:putative membrane protein